MDVTTLETITYSVWAGIACISALLCFVFTILAFVRGKHSPGTILIVLANIANLVWSAPFIRIVKLLQTDGSITSDIVQQVLRQHVIGYYSAVFVMTMLAAWFSVAPRVAQAAVSESASLLSWVRIFLMVAFSGVCLGLNVAALYEVEFFTDIVTYQGFLVTDGFSGFEIINMACILPCGVLFLLGAGVLGSVPRGNKCTATAAFLTITVMFLWPAAVTIGQVVGFRSDPPDLICHPLPVQGFITETNDALCQSLAFAGPMLLAVLFSTIYIGNDIQNLQENNATTAHPFSASNAVVSKNPITNVEMGNLRMPGAVVVGVTAWK